MSNDVEKIDSEFKRDTFLIISMIFLIGTGLLLVFIQRGWWQILGAADIILAIVTGILHWLATHRIVSR